MPSIPIWPRRTFLAASAATAATALTVTSPTAPPAAALGRARRQQEPAADDFAALRERWLRLRLGHGFDPGAEPYASRLAETGEQAGALLEQMRPADDSLFPEYPFDPPSGITQSYQRLATMTEGYVQPGTGRTGDPRLLDAVRTGLAHVHERVYHAGTEPYGNWWEWQIGSPRLLLDIVAMLHDELGAEQRGQFLAAVDHFLPESVFDEYTGRSTGANRVDFCRVYAVRGILGEAPGKIALATASLSPVFPYVTEGDGLYADGSFIQHTWVAYSGTYGYVLLDGLGRLFTLLDGTSWEVTDPARRIILDSVDNAYAPLLYDGLMMDSVSGRAISRGILKNDTRRIRQSDHTRGHQLIAAVALLGGGADEARRRRWNAMVRGWTERDTALPVLTDPQFDVADLARLHAVVDEDGQAAPEPVEHRLFPAMARAVHRRPGWCANVAMASDRIAYYEAGNGENPRGWHTGAGMLSWWGPSGTLDQYADDFWPTVDWYRLPGTTVSTKRLPDNAGGEWGEPKPDARWAGGVTDGEFAAVGQHVKGLESTLTARKSWFCLDDEIVCLGAGITCEDGTEVETVFDNRNLGAPARTAGAVALTVDGRAWDTGTRGTGRPRTASRAGWAHLEGHGGWIWPGGTRLRVLCEARTGAWSDINEGSVADPVTRRYVTLWTSHGSDPHDAGYAYVLMPGAGAERVAARAADRRRVVVDANTAAVQAVSVRHLGLSAANFWTAGSAGRLTSGAPSSVLVRAARGGGRRTATVHVAEPPRTGGPFEVTWHRPVGEVLSASDGVEVLGTGRSLRLRVTPGTAGTSVSCAVRVP
ncbi:polysaccharide lyase 8 family protein [Streptomyces sp. WMMB 322]|uniref:polysaccharide lyase 8 family protein n=1 Tax=Streptomyces sp. WMMB 322 TaxID=1286821 RepID=UPI0006E1D2AA|nr:polysaccharide lyase 8 family protein [Streptomyces sp. WMMB 322]SCK34428.1 hyaluronate lyase [Streptomyces sp. WMMB 322]